MQPDWQPGYDAQSERINATHPTAEIAKVEEIVKTKKKYKSVESEDASN